MHPERGKHLLCGQTQLGQKAKSLCLAATPLPEPGEGKLRAAFDKLEFMVCLDLFQNATGQIADLILPTPAWLER
ncbi:hypothetical protein C2W62_54050, partial [Candidatus Entotheonella serta]